MSLRNRGGLLICDKLALGTNPSAFKASSLSNLTQAPSPRDLARATGVVPSGYDRVASTQALRPLLENYGVDLTDVLVDSGLPLDVFDDPDNLIPFREGSRLLGLCVDRTGCEYLGLLIGKHTPLEALGIVAELAKSAPNVRTALLLLSRYMTLTDGGGLLDLSEDTQHSTYSYALYEPGLERSEVIYDLVLAEIWNILRELCGHRWLPEKVLFSHAPPSDLRPYRNFFRAPLRFDADRSAVVFDSAWLDAPLASDDPARLRALEVQARAMEAEAAGDLVGQIRRVMRRQLLSGGSSMQGVATELGMHRRTLDRQLKSCGIGFQALGDEIRYEISRDLLGSTRMSIIDIARSLHYADASAFTHAFRRWSDTTPTDWRESARSLQANAISARTTARRMG